MKYQGRRLNTDRLSEAILAERKANGGKVYDTFTGIRDRELSLMTIYDFAIFSSRLKESKFVIARNINVYSFLFHEDN
jgi:hypothetical protein